VLEKTAVNVPLGVGHLTPRTIVSDDDAVGAESKDPCAAKKIATCRHLRFTKSFSSNALPMFALDFTRFDIYFKIKL